MCFYITSYSQHYSSITRIMLLYLYNILQGIGISFINSGKQNKKGSDMRCPSSPKKKKKKRHKGNKKKNNQINQRLLKRKTKKAKKGMQRTYQGECNPH